MNDFTKEELSIISLSIAGNAYPELKAKIQSLIDNYPENKPICTGVQPMNSNSYKGKKMNFSQALEEIKAGKLLKRSGWNGKDQFVFLVNGSDFKVNREPLLGIFEEGTEINYRPHIDMKYQDGSVGVWLASMGDLMADDWEVIDEQ
jgi:hypothetical protein